MLKMMALASLTMLSLSALAGDVTITLNGGKRAAPSCQTEVQAVRTNGVIVLYLNGGDYCNRASVSLNGKNIGGKTLGRLFGAYAGDSVNLPEVDGANNYVITFSGNGRSDTVRLSVTKAPVQGPKIDVKINLTDASYADLPKCGGSVSAVQDVLGTVTVTFSGVDSCENGTLLSKNGVAPAPAINFYLGGQNGGASTRTIGYETLSKGRHRFIYKLWSKPFGEEGKVIREHIELTFDHK